MAEMVWAGNAAYHLKDQYQAASVNSYGGIHRGIHTRSMSMRGGMCMNLFTLTWPLL